MTRRARPALAGLTLSLALAVGCGEPPIKESAPPAVQPPAVATDSPASVPDTAPSATPVSANSATSAGTQAAPEADRSVLPADAPKDAEIVTDITPGVRGGQLVTATAGDPKTFNPILSQSAADQEVAGLQFSGLYGYDRNLQSDVPELAKSWEYDAATRTWTFHLREGIQWSDGEPLTSSDFMFYAELVFDPVIAPEARYHLYLRAEPKSDSPKYEFSAPDPHTLKITIPTEDAFAFQNIGLVRALPRHKLEAAYKEGKFLEAWGQRTDPADLVVSGPYKLKSHSVGEALIYERNPKYWRYDVNGTQLPYLDQLVSLIVEDSEAIELKFLAGDLDLIEGIKPDNLARFKDEAGKGNYTVFSLGASLNPNYYWFNLNQGGTYVDAEGNQAVWQPTARGERPALELKNFKPFVNPTKLAWFDKDEFRIACSEATNRQRMIDQVLFGEGAPLYGLEAPANKVWHNPDAVAYPYNPESARARLDKLGFVDRNQDGIREDQQGNEIKFTLITNREANIREKVAQLLKEDLRAVGLGAEVQTLEFKNLVTRLKDSYDYDAALLGAATGVPPHPSMATNTWTSSGEMHNWYPEQKAPMTEWEAEVDSLFAQLKRTFDLEAQRAIFFKMQDIVSRHQPMICLFTGNGYVAAKNKLGNLKPSIIRTSITHNIEQIFIKPGN